MYQFEKGQDLFSPTVVILGDILVVATGSDRKVQVLNVKENGVDMAGLADTNVVGESPITILDATIQANQLFCLVMTIEKKKLAISTRLFLYFAFH